MRQRSQRAQLNLITPSDADCVDREVPERWQRTQRRDVADGPRMTTVVREGSPVSGERSSIESRNNVSSLSSRNVSRPEMLLTPAFPIVRR